MVSEIRQFFRDHGIQEVEAIIPDMAGIARGKIMPAEKFAESHSPWETLHFDCARSAAA